MNWDEVFESLGEWVLLLSGAAVAWYIWSLTGYWGV